MFPISRFQTLVMSQQFRDIPKSCTAEELIPYLPKGYQNICNYGTDLDGNLLLIFTSSDTNNNTVVVTQSLFNPDAANSNCFYYPFIVEMSSKSDVKIDYANKHSHLVLNQNQLFVLVLHDRLSIYNNYSSRIYTGLMNKDIGAIRKFVNYAKPVSFNAKQKVANSYVILSFYQHRMIDNPDPTLTDWALGRHIANSKPREQDWPNILRDLNVWITSAGSMAETGTVTVKFNENVPIYRFVGHAEIVLNGKQYIRTIYDNKQSLPARLQTHGLGEHHPIDNPDNSCFTQDYILDPVNKVFTGRKDNCQKEAIVVFHPMDKETLRFVSGEIEIDSVIAETELNVKFAIEEIFNKIDVKVGQTYNPMYKPFTVGTNETGSPIELTNFKKLEVLSINTTSISGANKIRFAGISRAGNCRITSQTGLKGVTKVVANTGKILFPVNVAALEPTEQMKMLDTKSEPFRVSVTKSLHWDEKNFLSPNIVTGMNAVKAGSNTIVLARAALAVKLGYYVPTEKFGAKGLLNSLDVAEITAASDSLPNFKYVDREGKEVDVQVGLVYINYTEITDIYADWKPQSVMFETGKILTFQDGVSKELADYIFENHLDLESVEAVKELFKILQDDRAIFAAEEGMPVIKASNLLKPKEAMYNNSDFVLTKTSVFPSASRLLSDEYNPNGFYLDLTEYNGPCIRFPSAKVFNRFTGSLTNGEINYPDILIRCCLVLQGVINNQRYLRGSNSVFHNPMTEKTGRVYIVDTYLKAVKSTLYSDEEASQMVVQHLIKPTINGFGMKQVVEPLIPADVTVLMNPHKYRRVLIEAFSKDFANEYQLQIELANMYLETGTLSAEKAQQLLDDVPRSLCVRNPVLWEMQIQTPRVWDINLFRIHLKVVYGIDLHKYLHPRHNSDILLVSSMIALEARSDCDGDLLPMAIPTAVGQDILRRYVRPEPLPQEAQWNIEYIEGEYDSNKKLYPVKGHLYKLNDVPMFKINEQTDFYQRYLCNAAVAKANIGPATLDIWACTAVMQCYKMFCEQNNYKYAANGKDVALQPLNNAEFKMFSFAYTLLVQEKVIEAIKHAKNGSKDFEMFFLNNMVLTSNHDVIKRELSKPIYNMSPTDINKLLFIISWASHCGVLKACKNFISLYNKGRIPVDSEQLDKWEDFIADNTYFGSLVQPLFQIRKRFEASCNAIDEDFEISYANVAGQTTLLSGSTADKISDLLSF
jgi:hypothetical protein